MRRIFAALALVAALASLPLGLRAEASVTITAPTVELICNAETAPTGTGLSYANYAHKVVTVTDGLAICFRALWLGPAAQVGGTVVHQGILAQGDGDTDGFTLYITNSAPAGGVAQQMQLSIFGTTSVYKAGATWRLPVGTWCTVILSRESTTWKCRISGAAQDPDHNQTNALSATTTDKFAIGNDPNSLGLANFNGFVSDFAVFQGVAGAAPLSAQNKLDIESSFANALTITPASGTLVQYSHMTGDSTTDTAGGSNAYALAYVGVIAVPAPAIAPSSNGPIGDYPK